MTADGKSHAQANTSKIHKLRNFMCILGRLQKKNDDIVQTARI